MDLNTNQEVKEEVKPEKSAAELRKEKWKKFVFGDKDKQKEPMDKKDMLCYAGAAFFLIMALLPHIIRLLDTNYDPDSYFAKPVEEEEEDVNAIKKRLNCNKTVEDEGYSYLIEIENSYNSGNSVQQATINYTVTIDPVSKLTFEDIEIPDYVAISEIASKGVSSEVNNNVYTIKVDYRADNNLRTNNEILDVHNKILTIQRDNYVQSGYTCTTNEVK